MLCIDLIDGFLKVMLSVVWEEGGGLDLGEKILCWNIMGSFFFLYVLP